MIDYEVGIVSKQTVTVHLANKARMAVTLTITHHERTLDSHARTTIDHEEVSSYDAVSFTGDVFPYRSTRSVSCGQVYGDLPERHPVRIAWERWHLSDMRSHCAHQDESIPWDKNPVCDYIDGEGVGHMYRCGSKWLVEPVPAEVVTDLVALMDSYA